MNKSLRILLKILLGIFLVALVIFGSLYAIYNKPKPPLIPTREADLLAQKMLKAINYEEYQNTKLIQWTFTASQHHYEWDKIGGKVRVSWDDIIVHLQLNSKEKSIVFENGIELMGNTRQAIIEKATAYFNNDSFWLVAPFKIFDQGTVRSIVTMDDGSQGLLVTYNKGGSTPGDTFLWKLKANGFPENFQMWVKTIPIGGLEASWDDWKIMQNGLPLPVSHEIGPFTLTIEDVAAKN